VEGRILLKSFLSGMPECRLGLNSAGEDAVFPQFVNTSKWADERVVSFVPPDGEFAVMSYRCSEGIDMPFSVKTNVVEARTSLKARLSGRVGNEACAVRWLNECSGSVKGAAVLTGAGCAQIDCTVKALFDAQLVGNSVVVVLPLPAQTSVVNAVCTKACLSPCRPCHDCRHARVRQDANQREIAPHRRASGSTTLQRTRLCGASPSSRAPRSTASPPTWPWYPRRGCAPPGTGARQQK